MILICEIRFYLEFFIIIKNKLIKVADRMGFEPTRGLPLYSLSRGAPSTARPPVHLFMYNEDGILSRKFYQKGD